MFSLKYLLISSLFSDYFPRITWLSSHTTTTTTYNNNTLVPYSPTHSISLGSSFVNSSKTTSSASTTSLSSSRTSSTGSLRNLAPNKSTLFGGGGGATSSGSVSGEGYASVQKSSPPSTATPTPTLPSAPQQQHTTKPAISFGKPNFAPKPPGLQQLALANGQQRPAVTRHHSMKSPRYTRVSG